MDVICIWKLCNCPTPPLDEPCAQHHGVNCSQYNGAVILDETQIKDATTTMLDAAIAEMDADDAEIENHKIRMDTLLSDAKAEQQRAEDSINNAKTYSEGKKAADELDQAMTRSKARRDEMQDITNKTADIGEKTVSAIDRGIARLRIPFFDPAGYCACYQTKRQQLAALAKQITSLQNTLATLQTSTFPTAKFRVLTSFLSLVFPTVLGIVLAIKIGLWAFGFLPALSAILPIATALATLAAIVVIAYMIFTLISVARQIVQTRKKILQLVLSYYRLQQITTCMKVEDNDDDGDEDDEDEEGTGDAQHELAGAPNSLRSCLAPAIRRA